MSVVVVLVIQQRAAQYFGNIFLKLEECHIKLAIWLLMMFSSGIKRDQSDKMD